jgi:hypothetical protein
VAGAEEEGKLDLKEGPGKPQGEILRYKYLNNSLKIICKWFKRRKMNARRASLI